MGIKKATEGMRDELVAPDGGWGHLVNFGGILMVGFTLVPVSSFALIFGPFLSRFYDETSATTTVTSVYVTVFYITGLLANFLFQKMSIRKVALIGATMYCIGSFASIFVFSLQFLIVSYGIIQGLGTGLVVPATLTALNEYFDRKKMLAIALGQAVTALISIVYPGFTRILLDRYGFRGTQAVFTAISFHAVFGAIILQPVKWHMRRKPVMVDKASSEEKCYPPISLEQESEQLLNKNSISPNHEGKRSMSTSVSSFTSTVSYAKEKDRRWGFISNLMDLSLLKDAKYWNVAIGLSLSVTSEMSFMALLPVFLFTVGFTKTDVTLMMTVYFTADLVMKVIISILTAFCRFRSREVFLANILLTIVFRSMFIEIHSFWWTITLTAILGCSRCLIQVPLPLVIAESYSEKFSSAYSLCMVFTGISSLILGTVMGFVKHKTGSDAMVLHVLTAVCLLCVITWIVELTYKSINTKKRSNLQV